MRKPTSEFFDLARARRLPAQHPAVPLVLSFCSGFVDVTCFLGLFHSFTAFITGTVVILCSELFEYNSLIWMRVVVLATFFVSALAWIGIVKRLLKAGRPMLRIGLGLESGFLMLFMGSALTLPVSADFLAAGTALALVFATIAMSLQNAIMQLVLNYHIPTTVMTGNFMRFLITTVEKRGTNAAPQAAAPAENRAPTNHYGWSLLYFAFGGVLGALCLGQIGFWGILLPVLALAVMAVASRD